MEDRSMRREQNRLETCKQTTEMVGEQAEVALDGPHVVMEAVTTTAICRYRPRLL